MERLINRMRLYARRYNMPPYGREIEGTAELLIEAADELEHLRELVQRDREQACGAQAVNHGMNVTGEYDIDYDLICPSCGAIVGDAEYNELNGPFCHRCGQRLALPSAEAEAALEAQKG